MDRATWTGFLWVSSPGFRRCSFGSVVLWCWRVTEAFPFPFTPPWTETLATGLGLWGMQLGEFAERLIFHGELQVHWKCLIGTHQFWPMLQTRGVPWECGRSLGCWAAVVGRTQPCHAGCPWAGNLGFLQQSWKRGKREIPSFVRSFSRSALGSRGDHPLPASPTNGQPTGPGGCQEESHAMQAADCFV